MRQVRQILEKLKFRIRSKRGIAIMELAFFIPIGMILLYMIVDMATLLHLKYQIQRLAATVAQNTLSVINSKNKLTSADLKQIGETAILSLQGSNRIGNYNLYIAGELVQNKGTRNKVIWSAYCSKEGATSVVHFTYDTKIGQGVWKSKLASFRNVQGVKDAETIASTYSSSLNLGSNDGILVVTVIFNQSKTKGWFGISDLTYNAINKAFDGAFFSQSMILIDDCSMLFPPSE